jgi:uncharacterized protein (UPF0303 family)
MDAVPELDRLDHDAAWRLGLALAEHCRADRLPVTIAIWLGEQRVFHSGCPGSSADNDHWVERKAAVVRHFGVASAKVHATYIGEGGDVETFLRLFALPVDRYFPAGGAVPLVVAGAVVGVLAISGLAGSEDHDLAVSALTELARTAR